ncbi:MAG: MFS transporter, partial [Pseudomonadota bacterium]
MNLFPQEALNPGVRRREVFGWAMYDFANSGYTTVVITAVFSAYFVGGVAQNAPWATFAWT